MNLSRRFHLLPAAAAASLLVLLAGLEPRSARAATETSPCSKGLEAKGYTIRDIDNNGWYDEIDVTTKNGQRLELQVRRSDCMIMNQKPD